MAKREGAVHVLLGTRKGGYVLESDTGRRRWKVRGPYHAGYDVFNLVADPRRPGELYAAVNSPFWGPMLHRSKNWGATWTEIGTPLLPKRSERKPAFDPEAKPNPIVNLWRIEPGRPEEPDTLYLGVDPASLFVSHDRGDSWSPMTSLNDHPTRPKWNPGAGGMCLHSILWDPERRERMYVGISAAGVFRTDDGGASWVPKNVGVEVSFQPEKRPEVGQCVHHIVLDPHRSSTVYRQDHDGMFISTDGGDRWKRIGKPLGDDFGFVVATAPAVPGAAFFVPLDGRSRIVKHGRIQVYKWTERTGRWTPTIKGAPFPGDLGMHREGFASDTLDPAGLYLGTTTGQLLWSRDGASHWNEVPYRFPGIHSVRAVSPSG